VEEDGGTEKEEEVAAVAAEEDEDIVMGEARWAYGGLIRGGGGRAAGASRV
jgi:hypothetical protein